MSDNLYHKRTKTVTIIRQIDPNIPKNSAPWWCYCNTLIFYALDKEGKHIVENWETVHSRDGSESGRVGNYKENWRGEIPEAMLNQRWEKPWLCEVIFEEHFGWCLKITASHEIADKIWDIIFGHIEKGGINDFLTTKFDRIPEKRYQEEDQKAIEQISSG
jgi:hypothetical protein